MGEGRMGEGIGVRRIGAVLLGLALVVGGCSSDGGDDDARAAEGQVSGGEFSVAIKEPEHLIPANATSTHAGQVISALFTGLVDYDPETAEPRPAMAESITSDDQRTWTVKIKPGWTFHNGEPVTAASYVKAWNFAAYAPNGNENASFFSKIDGYDALQGDPDATPPVPPSATEMSGLAVVDDTTFTVRLTDPFSQFPLTLGFQGYYPAPDAAFADPKAFDEAPVGNGPFMMDGTWRHNEAIRVKRFEGYQGPPASAEAVEFRIFTEDGTSLRELQGDTLDVAGVTDQETASARTEFGDRLVERDSSAFNYLGFPMSEPAFAKKELRQAISMAIDRPAIIKAIFEDTKEPAASVVSPLVPGSRDDACRACIFDKEGAQKLLADAGGWKGTLRLSFATGRAAEEPMEAIANQLRDNLGITEIQFQPLEFAQLKAKITDRTVGGPFYFNWLMDYPSPQSYLEPLYTSGSLSNRTGYKNPAVDELIAEGNKAPSLDESVESYQAAEDIILDDMPVVPLWFGKTRVVHSDRLERVRIDPFSRVRVQDVKVVG